jgi:hypothetical protein
MFAPNFTPDLRVWAKQQVQEVDLGRREKATATAWRQRIPMHYLPQATKIFVWLPDYKNKFSIANHMV